MEESEIFKKCLIDPFGGVNDIQNGIIKTPIYARQSFKSDPLRLLRAIRFSTRYNFDIEEDTYKNIKKFSYTLLRISKERWVQELDKILLDKNVDKGLRMLWELEIFKFIMPELAIQWDYDQNSIYHDLTLAEHTIGVVKAAQAAGECVDVIIACLCHDLGKSFCRVDKVRNPETNKHAEMVKKYLVKNNSELARKHIIDGDLHTSHYLHHERISAELVLKIGKYLKWSNNRIETVYDLVKNHTNKDSPLKKYDDSAKSDLSRNMEEIFLK